MEDLIKEMAVLELEVVYLEKYLLSLYRKTFDQKSRQIKNENLVKNSDHSLSPSKESDDLLGGKTLTDSSIHRSHSSLSQRSARSFRTYAPTGALAEAIESYHSLPLSMLEVS